MQIREQSYIEASLHTKNTILRENLIRAFESIDSYLDKAKESLLLASKSPEWNKDKAHDFLMEHLTSLVPMLVSTSIYTDDGSLVTTTIPSSVGSVNISDRQYFAPLKNGADRFYFGPYMGRINNVWSYSSTRRLEAPDRSFNGIFLGTIKLSYFAEFCKDISTIEGVTTYILNAENVILIQCGLNVVSTEVTNKQFFDTIANGEFKWVKVIPLSNKYESKNWVLFTSVLPHKSDIRIMTVAPKSLAYQPLETLIHQNYLTLCILMGFEILCFLLLWDALIKAKKLEDCCVVA